MNTKNVLFLRLSKGVILRLLKMYLFTIKVLLLRLLRSVHFSIPITVKYTLLVDDLKVFRLRKSCVIFV